MPREIKRYLEESPQRYKVIGYSVKPTIERDLVKMDIRVSRHAPLDVTPYLNRMACINI